MSGSLLVNSLCWYIVKCLYSSWIRLSQSRVSSFPIIKYWSRIAMQFAFLSSHKRISLQFLAVCKLFLSCRILRAFRSFNWISLPSCSPLHSSWILSILYYPFVFAIQINSSNKKLYWKLHFLRSSKFILYFLCPFLSAVPLTFLYFLFGYPKSTSKN